jgi:hypothetical protein
MAQQGGGHCLPYCQILEFYVGPPIIYYTTYQEELARPEQVVVI